MSASAVLRATYDDNIDLVPDGGSAAAGYAASVAGSAAVATEDRTLKLDGQLGAARYPARPDRDSENGRLGVAGEWRGERLSVAADARAVLDTTRDSELVQTGVLLEPFQRLELGASLVLSYALSERASFSASASKSLVRYEEEADLVDYDDHSATLRLSYALTERISVGVSASVSLFDTADGNTRTRNEAFVAFANYAWSERLNFALSVGPDWSTSQRRAQVLLCDGATCVPTVFESTTRTRGRTYSLLAGYDFETGRLSVSAGQSLKPSGAGSVLRSENVDLAWSQRLRENLGWTLAGSAVQSRSPSGVGGSSVLFRIGTTLSWQLDPELAADFSLVHSRSGNGGDTASAVSNAATAGLRYTWPRWTGAF